MWYNEASGKFVPTEKRKKNRVTMNYQLDREKHRILTEMIDKANEVSWSVAGLHNLNLCLQARCQQSNVPAKM